MQGTRQIPPRNVLRRALGRFLPLSGGSAAPPPAFSPASLNPTAWFSAMTASSLWQDTGATSAVTAVTQTIARANGLSTNALHATQATAGSRPTYSRIPVGGRRNALTQTESFTTDWEVIGVITRTGGFLGPSNQPATLLVPGTVSSTHALRRRNVGTIRASQIIAKAAGYGFVTLSGAGVADNSVVFDVSTGVVSFAGTNTSGAAITNLGNGWYRCQAVLPSTTDYRVFVGPNSSFSSPYTGDGVSGIYACDPQLETGTTVTNYQRVITARDVSEIGVADVYYMFDDGADSLNWTAPAGTYDIAYVNSLGTVTVLTSQALSGAADITLPVDLVEYVAVPRTLTAGEVTQLTTYLQARANPL